MWMEIAAGLIDGIKPCVFSTLFFMSHLPVAKIRGRKLMRRPGFTAAKMIAKRNIVNNLSKVVHGGAG
jgi:hypothetical protein